MGFLTRVLVPKSARKPLRAARAVKNPVGYARRQVTPKPGKKALKVAHPVSTLETAAADAVNRASSKKTRSSGTRASSSATKTESAPSIAVRESDLPELLDKPLFLAWERHRVRLARTLARLTDPAKRYRDLILVTNVMAGQYEMVTERIAEVREATSQARSQGDASIVPSAQAWVEWAGPWLEAFDEAFEELKVERNALSESLPSENCQAIEDEIEPLWTEITDDVKQVLLKRLSELESGSGA